MSIFESLKRLLHPYYIINIILSISYLFCKLVDPICEFVFFDECEVDMRQGQILFFVLIIVMVRARKTGSVNLVSYLNNSFMYCKVANTVLWFWAWKPYGLLYALLYLLQVYILPEPLYTGPENVIYFRDEALFKEEISKKGSRVWLIEFYTTWNPACLNLAPIFSEISAKYSLPNLQFGKVDVGRLPQIAYEYGISDSPFSKQLPSLLLVKDGKPYMIRPNADSKGKLIKFHMNLENIVTTFDLNNLYNEFKPKNTSSTKGTVNVQKELQTKNDKKLN